MIPVTTVVRARRETLQVTCAGRNGKMDFGAPETSSVDGSGGGGGGFPAGKDRGWLRFGSGLGHDVRGGRPGSGNRNDRSHLRFIRNVLGADGGCGFGAGFLLAGFLK